MPVSSSGVSNYANTTAGTASGVSAGTSISGSGVTVTSTPANGRLLEDATTFRVLEDGTTYRVTEP